MVSLTFGLMRGFVGFGERSARCEDDVWHNTTLMFVALFGNERRF
jgi:hypothetical protein